MVSQSSFRYSEALEFKTVGSSLRQMTLVLSCRAEAASLSIQAPRMRDKRACSSLFEVPYVQTSRYADLNLPRIYETS